MTIPKLDLHFSRTSEDKIGLLVDKKLVGFLRYSSLDERNSGSLTKPVIGTKGTAYIESVEIFPGHKGHNYSQTLLSLVEKWFIVQGFTEMALTCTEPYLEGLSELGYTEKFRFAGPSEVIFLRKKLDLSNLVINS